jgi:hypothetical protein
VSPLTDVPDHLMPELIKELASLTPVRQGSPAAQTARQQAMPQDVSPTVQGLMDEYGMSREEAEAYDRLT